MKTFNGKAIYQPAGKAAEYSKWACNFYVGCSNGCEYCYCKHGRGAAVLGGDKPTLKKCFKDESHALEVFEKELKQNLPEIQKHGLFFSFTTDPLLMTTANLTIAACRLCFKYSIPVKLLSKSTYETDLLFSNNNACGEVTFKYLLKHNKLIAFGFTLTGHDELEKGASTNAERIEAMRKLHEAGFKTFASIEPIIDFDSSLRMIEQTVGFCDLYKIGLKSGDRWSQGEVRSFISKLMDVIPDSTAVYLKESIVKQAGFEYCLMKNRVRADYNMFNQ